MLASIFIKQPARDFSAFARVSKKRNKGNDDWPVIHRQRRLADFVQP